MAINNSATYAYGRSATPPKAGEVVGLVQHKDTRGTATRTSGRKGLDAGSSGAVLGRERAASDMAGPSPEDHVVAPGQRTVTAPKGSQQAVKAYK